MKTNFKRKNPPKKSISKKPNKTKNSNLSPKEFEEFIIKAGAAGSFMIFRSKKKQEELGLDQL